MASESEREHIRKEARMILDKFGAMLDKVNVHGASEREGTSVREEGKGETCNDDFRKRMFDNAPAKKGDCIVAEKAKW